MNDLRILDDSFEKHNDEIHFELLKRSNIVWINNENQGDYNKEIKFNTKSLASLLINYKDAIIIVEPEPDTLLQVSILHCIMLTYNSLENIK